MNSQAEVVLRPSEDDTSPEGPEPDHSCRLNLWPRALLLSVRGGKQSLLINGGKLGSRSRIIGETNILAEFQRHNLIRHSSEECISVFRM
jgi:hypothetical protein